MSLGFRFKLPVLAVLAALVTLWPSSARSNPDSYRFISPTGIDANTGGRGRVVNKPWKTIDYANAQVATTGDSNIVVRVLGSLANGAGSAQYTGFPRPASAPTGGARYFFYGNLADRTKIRISSAGAGDSEPILSTYTTIRNFYVYSHVKFGNANSTADNSVRFDSLTNCVVTGVVDMNCGDYNTVDACEIRGWQVTMNWYQPPQGRRQGWNFTRNYCPNLTSESAGGPGGPTDGSWGFFIRTWADSITVRANRMKFKNRPNWNVGNQIKLFGVHTGLFEDNKWEIENNANGGDEFALALMMRDSCRNITFNRDTIIVWGTCSDPFQIHLGSGNCTGDENITIDSCYWSLQHGDIESFCGAKAFTITNSTLVSGEGHAWKTNSHTGRNVYDHNTFIGGTPVGNLEAQSGVVYLGSTFATDSVIFTNNLVATFLPEQVIAPTSQFCGLYVGKPGSKFVSQWNQYAIWPNTGKLGGRSIGYRTSTDSLQFSGPYDAAATLVAPDGSSIPAWPNGFEKHYPSNDSLSIYGGADFDQRGPDSTYKSPPLRLFSPRIGMRDVGIGKGRSASVIGALQEPLYARMVPSSYSVTFWADENAEASDTILVFNAGNDSLRISSLTTSDARVTASFSATAIGPAKTAKLAINAPIGMLNPAPMQPGPLPADRLFNVNFATNDELNPAVNMVVYYRYVP